MLEIQRLTCVRDERVLFSELSFRVQPGEIVQIAGANGVGKTSLLRIITGLARPEAGQVCWQGKPLAYQREQYHRQLLWLGHQPGVKRTLSADENLRFFHPQTERAARWQALAAVGLAGYEDLPLQQLSAGQQRRVALGRLWLSSASLWLLDEPLTALDTRGIDLLTRRLGQHADSGGSVILTTHQPLRLSRASLHVITLTVPGDRL